MQDHKVQENQEDSEIVIMPNIDEDIALPKNAHEALPELSPTEELEMRVNTIKLLSDLKGENINPTQSDIKQATELATAMMQDPSMKPEFGNYPNETMAYLAGLVAQTNCMLTKELADYKLYVLNNMVKIVESDSNNKEKIAALRTIGEIDGVDAFKKRTEVTHKLETLDEVESELLTLIGSLKGKVIDAEVIEVKDVEEDN
jgi:hypothetical protein